MTKPSKPFPTIYQLNELETQQAWDTLKLLKKERPISETDYLLIAQLMKCISSVHGCDRVIDDEGLLIVTETNHGTVYRPNAAVAMRDTMFREIRCLCTELLMSPKAKASINKTDLAKKEKEEEDPLTAMLKKRASKKG